MAERPIKIPIVGDSKALEKAIADATDALEKGGKVWTKEAEKAAIEQAKSQERVTLKAISDRYRALQKGMDDEQRLASNAERAQEREQAKLSSYIEQEAIRRRAAVSRAAEGTAADVERARKREVDAAVKAADKAEQERKREEREAQRVAAAQERLAETRANEERRQAERIADKAEDARRREAAAAEHAAERAADAAEKAARREADAKRGHGIGAGAAAGAVAAGNLISGAAVGASYAIGDMTVEAVQSAASMGEALSKTGELFADNKADMEAWAASAADNLGMSKLDALQAAGKFGALFRAWGYGADEATELSKNSVKLAADIGSFNDMSVDDAIVSLMSGFSGESEPMKKFGSALSETRIKAEAVASGLVKAEVDTLQLSRAQEAAEKASRKAADALKEYGAEAQETKDAVRDQEQAEAALAAVMEGKVPTVLTAQQKFAAANALIRKDTFAAENDFEKTADSASNSWKRATSELKNIRDSIGTALLPSLTKALHMFIDEGVPRLRSFGVEFGKLVDRVSPYGTKLMAWFESNKPKILEVLGSISAGAQKVFEIALAVGMPIFEAFRDRADKLASVLQRLWPDVQPLLTGIADWISSNGPVIAAWIGEAIAAGIRLYDEVIYKVINFVIDNIPKVKEAFNSLKEMLAPWIEKVKEQWAELGPQLMADAQRFWADIQRWFDVAKTWVSSWWNENGANVMANVERVVKFIVDVIGTIVVQIGNVISLIRNIANGDWSAVWEEIKDIVKTNIDLAKSAFDNIGPALVDALKASLYLVRDAAKGLGLEMLAGITDGLGGAAGWIGNKLFGANRASGGPVSGGIYTAGERGPETIFLPGGSYVQPAHTAGATGRGGGGNTINITLNGANMTPDDVAAAVAWNLRGTF